MRKAKNYMLNIGLSSSLKKQILDQLKLKSTENFIYSDVNIQETNTYEILKIFSDFMVEQQKWNKKIQEELDKNTEQSRIYINDQILAVKQLIMGKMEIFNVFDEKIQKNNRQIEQKMNTLYEETFKKKQKQAQDFVQNIICQINNLKQILGDKTTRLTQENQRYSSIFDKYKWILRSPQWQDNFQINNDTITSKKNNCQFNGYWQIYKFQEATIKIQKMNGKICLGLTNYNQNGHSSSIYYNCFNGIIYNDLGNIESLIQCIRCKEGGIISLNANTITGTFTFKITNSNKNKSYSEIIFPRYYSKKWKFFILFEKKGDSVTLLK